MTDRSREGHGRSRFRWHNGDNRLDNWNFRRCAKELIARRRSDNFNFPGYTVRLSLVTAEAVSKLKAPSTNIASSLPVLIVPSRYKRRNQWKREGEVERIGEPRQGLRNREKASPAHECSPGQVLQGTKKKLRNPITRAIDLAGSVAPSRFPSGVPVFLHPSCTRLYYQRGPLNSPKVAR